VKRDSVNTLWGGGIEVLFSGGKDTCKKTLPVPVSSSCMTDQKSSYDSHWDQKRNVRTYLERREGQRPKKELSTTLRLEKKEERIGTD